jgi:iron complex transport system substrate-binding protein
MERIASLLPSTTEIACALGFEKNLVGRSHECDYPDSIRHLPTLTAPKLDPGGTSREIDDRVKQLVRDGLSVYRVDAERLRELAPSVILTQDQCEVCAASLADVEQALAEWIGVRPTVLSLNPRRLGDVWGDTQRVAEALGAPERGRVLAERLTQRVAAVSDRTQRIRKRPSVACIEWIDPLMAAGNWMPELVELAGGRNLFGDAGSHSPWLDWETLVEAVREAWIGYVAANCEVSRSEEKVVKVIPLRPRERLLRRVRSTALHCDPDEAQADEEGGGGLGHIGPGQFPCGALGAKDHRLDRAEAPHDPILAARDLAAEVEGAIDQDGVGEGAEGNCDGIHADNARGGRVGHRGRTDADDLEERAAAASELVADVERRRQLKKRGS